PRPSAATRRRRRSPEPDGVPRSAAQPLAPRPRGPPPPPRGAPEDGPDSPREPEPPARGREARHGAHAPRGPALPHHRAAAGHDGGRPSRRTPTAGPPVRPPLRRRA